MEKIEDKTYTDIKRMKKDDLLVLVLWYYEDRKKIDKIVDILDNPIYSEGLTINKIKQVLE